MERGKRSIKRSTNLVDVNGILLAAVIFRPENGPDGSFALVSDGRRSGEAGYYRVHHTCNGALRVKCVPMEEATRLFVDSAGTLRAHHTFAFEWRQFFTLHYQIAARHCSQIHTGGALTRCNLAATLLEGIH